MTSQGPLFNLPPIPGSSPIQTQLLLNTILETEDLDMVSRSPNPHQRIMTPIEAVQRSLLAPIGLIRLPTIPEEPPYTDPDAIKPPIDASKIHAGGRRREPWSYKFHSVQPCARPRDPDCEEYLGLLQMHGLERGEGGDGRVGQQRSGRAVKDGMGEGVEDVDGQEKRDQEQEKEKIQKEGKMKRLLKVLRFWV